MNILVTGGAGFIGSHFIEWVLHEHPEDVIVNIDALTYAGSHKNMAVYFDDPRHHFVHEDICSREVVQSLFREHSIDAVVNFAAESHVDNSIESADAFIRTNIQGTYNLLMCAKEYWLDSGYKSDAMVRFLQVSTDEVYGSVEGAESFDEEAPLRPGNPYAASKASGDLMALAFAATYTFPLIISRCCNNYGPHQHMEKLIPKLMQNTWQNKDLPLYGDGLQIREWIHVSDHCKALDKLLRKGRSGNIYHIGTGAYQTNMNVARLILKYLNRPESLITSVEDRLNHDRRYALNSAKIKSELNWEPCITFEEGLEKLCKAFEER